MGCEHSRGHIGDCNYARASYDRGSYCSPQCDGGWYGYYTLSVQVGREGQYRLRASFGL